jgi:YbgC/YbaW family acyl-CoA thioester hydrolase
VAFHETDMAGLVHFSRFFTYMEEGEHALWRAAGVSIHPKGSDLGWPRLHASFEYHRPLRFEDEFEIRMRVTALEEKSIRYVCELTREGTRIATGHLAIACVRLQPNEPLRGIPIPKDVLARFAVAEERPVA